MRPDSFLAGIWHPGVRSDRGPIGRRWYEADHAVITRENWPRAAAHRHGFRACFSPMPEAVRRRQWCAHPHEPRNGGSGEPITHDAARQMGLSMMERSISVPACCIICRPSAAITAPSPVSYLRLTPNRWAPTLIDIVQQDRGAALRVCPTFAAADPADMARQFNIEFRVVHAAASPYLALGAVIFAGADGLQRKLGLPPSADRAEQLPHSLGKPST